MNSFINIFTGISSTAEFSFDELMYTLETDNEIYETVYITRYE